MTDREMVRLESGSVVALRFYDLGRAVDPASLTTGDVERPQFATGTDGVRYAVPPAELLLDDVEIPLEGGRVFADATVRVFDFGIAAVALRVLVGGLDWDRFTERVEEIGTAVTGDTAAWSDVEERTRRAGVTLPRSAAADHLFVVARRFDGIDTTSLLDEEYAPSIVSSEWLPLTSLARADLMRSAVTNGRDLVVVGEQRTFIVEPRPGSGVPDAVEAALAQRAFHDAADADPKRRARARALVEARRTGRLAVLYAAARDRFRLLEAESSAAATGAGSASVPILPLVIVALLSSILTALLVLALG